MKIKPTAGPGPGFWPDNDECVVTARGSAIAAGDMVRFLLVTGDDAAVTNNDLGDSASGLANVLLGDTVIGEALTGIALEDIADDAQGRVLVTGIAPGVTTGTTTPGIPLTGGAAGVMALSGAAETVYGIALDATDPGRVLFNGWGMGVGLV